MTGLTDLDVNSVELRSYMLAFVLISLRNLLFDLLESCVCWPNRCLLTKQIFGLARKREFKVDPKNKALATHFHRECRTRQIHMSREEVHVSIRQM